MNNKNINPLKLYIVPVLVLISIILLVPLVLMPQLDTIRDKNLEVQKKQKRLEILSTKLELLDQINEVEETEQLLEMEKIIPSDKHVASLVVGVRSLASSSKLSVSAMELSPGNVATASASTSASKRVKSQNATKEEDVLKFTLQLHGKKLKDFQKFFNNIEKSKRLLGIESVEIARQDEDGDYLFDMEAIVPYKEIKSTGDVIAEPLPEFTSTHQTLYDFVVKFVNYTNVAIQKVKTGVKNPFK